MFRRILFPMLMVVFALFSLVTLKSIAPSLLGKQAFYFLLGGGIFYFTSQVPFWRWQRISPYLYWALIFLLLLTRIIGQVTRGTTSRIPIGSFHVQASQLAVPWVGLFICGWLSQKPITSFSRLLQFLAIIGLPAFIIFIQPELGTTLIYTITLGSIFILSRTKSAYLWATLGILVVMATLGWNVLRPYQKDRILSYLNSAEQSQGASYNAEQSVIAVGSGQLYGRGIGQGIQSHLRFLPERQTDFIFASFSEEMGLIGALPVVLLYSALVFFLIYLGTQAETEAEQYFCFCTAAMIAAQTGVNIGMNMGLVPITGITLPFFSYGGSSILALSFQFGCVQAILLRYQKRISLHVR